MRSLISLLASVLLVLGAASPDALAQSPSKQKQGRPPLGMEKITDDLFVIIGNGGNVGVLVTDEGVVLVDDKFEEDYDGIIARVKSVTNQPVKYVITTHHHSDHSGGNTRFIEVAEIISHKNARANITGGKQPGAPANLKPARITFTDETSVFLGGKEVRARYFGRGHTNGDVIVYFPAQRVIHTGDLMAGLTPLIDYAGGGSLVEWIKTVDAAMAALDFDRVIPGHGTVTNRAGLQTYRDNVVKLRDDVAAQIRQGKSQEEIRAALATQFPTVYGNPNSMQNRWSLPGFLTELR
ncbi:MAG: MBL fold metallo-hydrolase [Verrucomicrobia bacterium]|nr:MBL fold metallo-hydrolase [Verrucomicrobiota bacterium]